MRPGCIGEAKALDAVEGSLLRFSPLVAQALLFTLRNEGPVLYALGFPCIITCNRRAPSESENPHPMNPIRNFLRHSTPGRIGLALTSILVVAALAAPWLAPYNPIAQNLPVRLAAPSSAHWMGTHQLGRDILSRLLFGARVSMLVSISVVLGAGLIGLSIGSVAGYFGGWFDRLVNVVLINAFLSFPGILLAIAFAAFLGPGLGKVILALVITGWAGYARLARAQILQAKEMEYVLAARSLGASNARILLRHLLPNILQPVLVQATIAMAGAILAESTLSFLGVGVLAQCPAGAPCSTTPAATSSTPPTS